MPADTRATGAGGPIAAAAGEAGGAAAAAPAATFGTATSWSDGDGAATGKTTGAGGVWVAAARDGPACATAGPMLAGAGLVLLLGLVPVGHRRLELLHHQRPEGRIGLFQIGDQLFPRRRVQRAHCCNSAMIFCNAWGSGREESAAAAGAVAAAAGVDGGGGPAGLELAVDQGDVAQPLKRSRGHRHDRRCRQPAQNRAMIPRSEVLHPCNYRLDKFPTEEGAKDNANAPALQERLFRWRARGTVPFSRAPPRKSGQSPGRSVISPLGRPGEGRAAPGYGGGGWCYHP